MNPGVSTAAADYLGVDSAVVLNTGGAYGLWGMRGSIWSNSTVAQTGGTFGVDGGVTSNASGTINAAYGLHGYVVNQGGGTILYAFGLAVGALVNSSGTVNYAYGASVTIPTVGTNANVGLGLSNDGNGPNGGNYAVWVNSTYANYFSSNVGINSSVPRAKLDVEGSVYIGNGNVGLGTSAPTSTLQVVSSGTFGVPNGANPSVSSAGQISVDTSATSGGMLRIYTDAERAIPTYFSKGFIILSPTAASDYSVWRVPYAITIRAIHVLTVGGTNVIGGLDEADANGLNPVAVDSDITATAGTNANDDGSLSNPTIASGVYLNWHTTSVSGSPTSVTVTFDYTVDPVN